LLNAMGGQHSIVNNVFSAGNSTGTAGIYVGYSNIPAVVTGNTFYNLATGVNLVGTSGWNVQANAYP
jgi:putative cofactor-binding repeat protein